MGFYTKVAGVTFEGRQRYIRNMLRNNSTKITLRRDRNNPYDSNAVAVINEYGEQIGFLSRQVASSVAPRMDMGIRYQAMVSAINATYVDGAAGVNIYIEEI